MAGPRRNITVPHWGSAPLEEDTRVKTANDRYTLHPSQAGGCSVSTGSPGHYKSRESITKAEKSISKAGSKTTKQTKSD